MKADFPSERWFWFTPTFHPGQSALLHKQPDNIYRIDLQLGPDADPEEEKKPENVIPRIEKVVGGRPFKLDWVSVYSFNCRRIDRFVHDRVIFVGDSAHVVSPFGARGGNGGMHDVDNLCWKLARVVTGQSDAGLLDSYNDERVHGADENIRHSSWTSRFMSPEPGVETAFRNAALSLAVDTPFARRLVNAGRLSVPCRLTGSPLNGDDDANFAVPQQVGMVALDAPVTAPDGSEGWLMNQLGGGFTLLVTGDAGLDETDVPDGVAVVRIGAGGYADAAGKIAERYGDGIYLIRPDQHVTARWRKAGADDISDALARCTARVAA